MSDATISDLAQQLQLKTVPHNTTWTPANLLQIPSRFETDITVPSAANNGNILSEEPPISGDLPSAPLTHPAPGAAGTTQNHSAGVSSNSLHKTVFAHGPPGPYGELPKNWRAPASLKMHKVNNTELGEYLIGIEAKILCPIEYWKEDKVTWTIQVMDQTSGTKVRGGHKYKCVLLHSQPPYVHDNNKHYECEMTAQALRHVIKVNHGGESKTLEQMFDPDHENVAGAAWAMVSSMSKKASYLYANWGKRLQRIESRVSSPSLIIGMVFSAMICDGAFDDESKSYACIRPVPRSIYDIKGRPDADLWMSACDKEVDKLLEMVTFEIVNTEDIPAGHKVMDMCVSFKIKQDSQGNVTEYRARFNADGRQQEEGSYGDTFAPTSKFSCVRTICVPDCTRGSDALSIRREGCISQCPMYRRGVPEFSRKIQIAQGQGTEVCEAHIRAEAGCCWLEQDVRQLAQAASILQLGWRWCHLHARGDRQWQEMQVASHNSR